jgi:hypothetical protein
MHPLLLSVANIKASVRMKATAHAFALAAYLPIPKFLDVGTDVQAVLSARVFHHCIGKVVANLKTAEQTGVLMSDPFGRLRINHTPLVAWIADHPEQRLLACVDASTSPVSLALVHEFDDIFPHPPRTREHALAQISALLNESPDPWDLGAFLKACGTYHLNGVFEPFWGDWGGADPSIFLTPDALHQWHKFFYDHPLKWVINIMTGHELDFRLSVLQPRVGVRHWSSGVSKLKQCTGREHRNIETQLVAAAAGAIPPQALCAIRSIVDFIFQAQRLQHCDETLHSLKEALREFHHYKGAIVAAGGRLGRKGVIPHFRLPKLEMMQHVVRSIRATGAAYQWTSDITERCHITHAKTPYRHSSRHNFHAQCCRFMDRDEKRRFFDLYLLLKHSQFNIHDEIQKETGTIASISLDSEMPSISITCDERFVSGSRPSRNFFSHKRGQQSKDGSVALYVNKLPHLKLTVDDAAHIFKLPDLRGALGDFYSGKSYDQRRGQRVSLSSSHLPFDSLQIWTSLKIQRKSSQDPTITNPPQTAQCLPPSAEMAYGRCNTFIVDSNIDAAGVQRGWQIF